MKLKEQISTDYITAMKEKNVPAKNLLSVIKGDIQNIEKDAKVECLSDEEVIKVLTKTAKNLKEVNDDESKIQLAIVEGYLPKQMSREEIVLKVTELVNSGITNIGGIMKEFAILPVDKKIVSEVIKEVL
jgi:hypothetical protein